MSFILDALKKLEREKQAREPEIVVVGPVPWGGADRGGARQWLVVSGVVLAAILGGIGWWLLALPSVVDPMPSPATSPIAVAPTKQEATTPPGEDSTPPRQRPAVAPPAPAPRRVGLPADEPDSAVTERSSAPAAETPVANREEPHASAEAVDADDVEFRLSAISTRDGEPVALLNDRLVREGDAFDGVRIVRIGATEIEIEVDGERRTIGF